MNKTDFYKRLGEELEEVQQEEIKEPMVWFGIGLGVGCAIKAMGEIENDGSM